MGLIQFIESILQILGMETGCSYYNFFPYILYNICKLLNENNTFLSHISDSHVTFLDVRGQRKLHKVKNETKLFKK